MEQALKCDICLVTPSTLLVLGCKSCEYIISFSTSVCKWYGRNIKKHCPECWGISRLANSFMVRGLDDLFSAAKNLNQSLSSPDVECPAKS